MSRLSSSIRTLSLSRHFHSSSVRSAKFRQFDPEKILPSGFGEVRICSNTSRDAQQSNLSAEMASIHRKEIGKLIDDCYKGMAVPGYEQIWGGTVPMFDIWKRGVHPFDDLRALTDMMPNTPSSMLIRSNSLTSMNLQPRDVVDEFVNLSIQGGVNVFTCFDANNDTRNHRNVAEAVRKYGGHYQAALSWAVYHKDPTIYNVEWAVDFFREVAKMGAHSLYVKDPSGVLTPEMAGVLAAEIKSAFPHLPLVFHTHYQTGYAYMTYLEAVKNGANGIECSAGFADGAGQPYSLTMLRALEDYGFNTGNPNREALTKINKYCNSIRHLYPAAQVVRTPDIAVEQTGIAGGQRSILDKELIDAGQPHLIPEVDVMVQKTRDEGGKVCQVTPAADSYAREALRRLRGGDASKNFAPGYAAILTEECGSVKEPVVSSQQQQALLERAIARATALLKSHAINKATYDALVAVDGPLKVLRDQMYVLAEPVQVRARIVEVSARINQLNAIKSKKHLNDSLNRKIALANATVDGKPVRTIDDRIAILQHELTSLQTRLKSIDKLIGDEEYADVLRGTSSESTYLNLLQSNPAKSLYDNKSLSMSVWKSLVQAAGVVTCDPTDLLPAGLAKARAEVAELDEQYILGLRETELKERENVVIQASFGAAAIPNLTKNFFLNVYENPSHWKPTYKVDAKSAAPAKKSKAAGEFLPLNLHRVVETVVGSKTIADLKSLYEQKLALTARLKKLEDPTNPATKLLAEQTKVIDRVRARLTQVSSELDAGLSSASSHVEQSLSERPGVFSGRYPTVAADGTIHYVHAATKKDVEIAIQCLKQIVQQS